MQAGDPGVIVVKIGGSTLGVNDTTLEDVATLHARGAGVVVVHGGGPIVSEWLGKMNIPTEFVNGLRVTDEASLDVVVSVLAGLVNKRLVASLAAKGVNAIGLAGSDGNMLRAEVQDESLGLVGEIVEVDGAPLIRVLLAGGLPVLAPIGIEWKDGAPTGQLLNINADIAAGAVAEGMPTGWTVFLTDVPGVKNAAGEVMPHLTPHEVDSLIADGVIDRGMIPKVRSCVYASANGGRAVIIDGREEHALLRLIDGAQMGTVIG